MTAAAAPKTEEVLSYPLRDILPSAIPNYRRRVSPQKLEEMAESMRTHGVLEPIVVRPDPRDDAGGVELVFGEQRLKAAHIAGLEHIPTIVRDYADTEIRELRLIENEHRSDVHPLDQAEEYSALTAQGYTPQLLAERLGQPVRYVLERLALNSLCEQGRKFLEAERISLAVATLVASLPTKKMQESALERVAPEFGIDGMMSLKDARAEIEDGVMLELGEAPFKLDDAALVPKAGPCTTCKKRSGNQAELFADAKSKDMCLDSACYEQKLDAVWKLRVKSAKAEGVTVLNAKESAEALRNSHWSDGEFQKADDTVRIGKGNKKVKTLLGKEAPITLARDERTGLAVELVPRKLVEQAVKAASPKTDTQRETPDARAKKEREKERVQAEVRRRTMIALVTATENRYAKGATRELLNLLVRGALGAVWNDISKKVADRRGLPVVDEAGVSAKPGAKRQAPKLTPAERIERSLPELDDGQLLGLLLELLMGRAAPGKWSEAAPCYVDACELLGISPAVFEASIKVERKQKADAKAKAPPPKRRPQAQPEQPDDDEEETEE